MELERETLDNLITYLKSHGYPDESFAIEYKIGKLRIDLAIIDPESQLPILVFEVKSRFNQQSIAFGKRQLEIYIKELKDNSIPAYLVFPKKTNPFFSIHRISLNTETNEIVEEQVTDKTELNFLMQKQSRISERIEKNKTERKSTIDKFSWVSWGIAIIILAIGILKKLKIIIVDTTDLAIIGACIGLIILPFSNKLKFLGMEFERFEMTQKNNTKK